MATGMADFLGDKPTEAELRGEEIASPEPAAPAAVETTPAAPAAAEPAVVDPAAAEPAEPAEPTPDYAALYEHEKTARATERAGLLRAAQEARMRQQMVEPQQAQVAPSVAQPVPIKFNERGEAYIEQPVPQAQQMHPLDIARQRGDQLRQSLIMEDPVSNAQPVNRIYNAYLALDQMVGARMASVPAHVRSVDDVISYINSQGLDREIAAAFPDVVRTYEDLELLVEAGTELSERKVRRLMRGVSQRAKDYAAAQSGAAPAGAPAAAPPPASVGNKPRSQAQRGEGAAGVPPDRLSELDAKDPWSWTKAEGEEYARLTKNAT